MAGAETPGHAQHGGAHLGIGAEQYAPAVLACQSALAVVEQQGADEAAGQRAVLVRYQNRNGDLPVVRPDQAGAGEPVSA